jgi:hypothetical protein
MKFEGTQRNRYSKEKVRELRQNRKLMKPKKEGVSQQGLDNILGELQAAGHLRINGFRSMGVENIRLKETDPINKRSYELKFDCYSDDGLGERPHLQGYLESASNADKKPYRIKGWFNEDGSIRIELVK